MLSAAFAWMVAGAAVATGSSGGAARRISGGVSPKPSLPHWTAPAPDPSKPLGGYERVKARFTAEIYKGEKTHGTYNHNVMVGYTPSTGMIVQWKNCDTDEDCNGQRMLYSHSADGQSWSSPPRVLFPNMTTPGVPTTLEPGPPVYLNGHMYMAASPGFHNTTHDASAQGSQFCLWPDPVNPRNCGPPSRVAVQYNNTLLLRRVLPDGDVGPVFWASAVPPEAFAAATATVSIKTLAEMDDETRRDVAGLGPRMRAAAACGSPNETGTLKCEACDGGCQIYDSINYSLKIANERCHWTVPCGGADVIAYRSEDHQLWASVRSGSLEQSVWAPIEQTDIPNDNSNLNAGALPDGRIYLVHNPVTPADGKSWSRDPVTLATSRDGYAFDTARVALTCHDLGDCEPRFEGHAKNPGPSYPQAITLVAPAPEQMRGLYVVASNNKEDIWITKIDFDDV